MSLPPILYRDGKPAAFRPPYNRSPADVANALLEARAHDASAALAEFVARLQGRSGDRDLSDAPEEWAARVIRVLVTGEETGGKF